jgi:rfaE bifunctional protein kinase chain/domain
VEISEINQIFEQFRQMQVIVIGDSMIDSYLWGKVERVSPEAPVPVVSVNKRENRLGGAGNVSLNMKALGAAPYLFTVIGDDDKGRKFRKLLAKEGLSGEGVFEDKNRITTVKSRIISKGQHIVRVDEETSEYIDLALQTKIVTAIEKLIEAQKIDVIVFVDYDKGLISQALFEKVNAMALNKGIPTAVDPKKRNFSHYKDITLFKPNFKEFTEGVGIPLEKGDFVALKAAAESYKKKQNFKLIFITLSELGVLISNGLEEQHYPAIVRDIADVSGAGDTVISVASLAMAAGLSQKTMALMSNLAGGLVCEKAGVAPIVKDRLIQEMKAQNI